ncbi:MAG: amino acid adenylation domain-containing protein, partial [bacterium]|nr:amino acid adenylation domain-containing protein [bacterium]
FLELSKTRERLFPLTGVRVLVLTGERVTPGLVNQFYENYQVNLVNAYGQSECSDDTLHYHIPYDKKTQIVPVGHPANNTQVYILGIGNRPQPIGVRGELYIAGDGLAMGYLNNPELTAETFILRAPFGQINPRGQEENHQEHDVRPSPIAYRPSPLFKTGDQARWLADGHIEFLGRVDTQVKIRGFRIELQEIENRLLQHKNIKEVVVIDRQMEGDKYLCAYVVAWRMTQDAGRGAQGEDMSVSCRDVTQMPIYRDMPDALDTLDTADLANYLSEKLPGYMVPSYFVFLDK